MMNMKNDRWTREQTIVAFNLYCKIPFQKASSTNPDIIRIAKIIGRSPNSVKMKIGNFGSFDPELKKKGIVGLANTSKLDEIIWNEFHGNWDELAFESEELIAKFQNKKVEEIYQIDLENIPLGKERIKLIKTRINQNFFRTTILASYNQRCCITGLQLPSLLVASHIIPWSKNVKERLNPQNGICLNSLHDKAFDKGLLTITTDYKIKLSSEILFRKNNKSINDFFIKYENKEILLPDRFLPGKEFLDYHYHNIFRK